MSEFRVDVAGADVTVDAEFSISKFRAQIGSVARPNLWTAQLNIASSDVTAPPESFSFRCEKAEIPGRTVATIDDTGSGPALKIPYEINYNDIELTIICGTDMAERKYFENWIDKIVYPARGGDNSGLLNYYSSYARGNSLNLVQLGDDGSILIAYVLHDIYPIQISPMNLSWEENNTYQRFNVTINYRYHRFAT